MRVLTKDISRYVDKEITVAGWVHRVRDLGGVCFLILRDRSGTLQTVFEKAPEVTLESVVSITGKVQANPKAPGGCEVVSSSLTLLSAADPELPIQVNQDPDKLSIEALLDNRMLSVRNLKVRSIFALQSAILHYFADFMRSRDFMEIKTSKLIGSGSEGGTGLFEVAYFDRTVFLAQSPQLYKQAMVSSGYERVFEIGAAYRAEKHETPRHLNEYVSLDVEMGFIENDHDLMDLETEILTHLFKKIDEHHQDVLELFNASVPSQDAMAHIPRVSYDEAKKIISSEGGKKVFELNHEGERLLCEWSLREHGADLVYVHSFPRKKRPFYTYPDGSNTMSFDLIFRGLEITSGSRRINDYTMLLENLPKFGLKSDDMEDYLSVFKYGSPPHGGFAIGLERLTQKILNLKNVKEASLFPRDRNRVRP